LKRNIILILFFLTLNVTGYCGQASRIELTDGSVVNGEVTSFTNGSYTVKTASLGEMNIDAVKVAKIESVGPPALNAPLDSEVQPSSLTPSEINSYRQKLMSNPDNAALLKNLADNPQVQALAEDPEVVDAVKTGNVQGLEKNKKFTAVVNNPQIQETAKEIKQ